MAQVYWQSAISSASVPSRRAFHSFSAMSAMVCSGWHMAFQRTPSTRVRGISPVIVPSSSISCPRCTRRAALIAFTRSASVQSTSHFAHA